MPTTDFAEKAAAHLPVCADIAFTIISGRTSYAAVQPAAARTTQMTRFGPFSEGSSDAN